MVAFDNCLVDQPEGLIAIEVEVEEADGDTYLELAYYCPQCEEGYTFNWMEYNTNHWNCDLCATAIPNCDLCEDDGTCRTCKTGWTPSYDRATCIQKYADCLDETYTETAIVKITDSTNAGYWIEYEDWKCSECATGFYWIDREDNSGGCVGICSDFDNRCENCDVEGECTVCGCEWMVWDGECVDKVKNCNITEDNQPDDLTTNADGSYSCTCNTGYSWDSDTMNCLSCADWKCASCQFFNGYPTCSSCTPGHVMNSD